MVNLFFSFIANNLTGTIAIASLVISGVVGALSFKFKRKDEYDKEFKAQKEINAKQEASRYVLEMKLLALEKDMENLATHKDITAVIENLGSLSGDIKSVAAHMDGLNTAVKGVQNQVSMINTAMVKGNK